MSERPGRRSAEIIDADSVPLWVGEATLAIIGHYPGKLKMIEVEERVEDHLILIRYEDIEEVAGCVLYDPISKQLIHANMILVGDPGGKA